LFSSRRWGDQKKATGLLKPSIWPATTARSRSCPRVSHPSVSPLGSWANKIASGDGSERRVTRAGSSHEVGPKNLVAVTRRIGRLKSRRTNEIPIRSAIPQVITAHRLQRTDGFARAAAAGTRTSEVSRIQARLKKITSGAPMTRPRSS
jgi:hypothetical protein